MTRSWIACATVALAAATTVPRLAAQEPSPLTVRAYNTARIPQAELSVARITAIEILRDTGLAVTFRQCGRGGSADGPIDACDETLKSFEVVVRIIDAPAFNATLEPDAYGVTYIVNETNRGWLATVFSDRIHTAAARVDVDAGTLIGRVMAHELGHLLLGRDYHGPIGVMQASWSDAMLTRPNDAWRFTMPEAARMRQNRSLFR